MRNVLYYGDNLPIMREHTADESVDLVCLDPPFNSARDYNVLFKQAKKDENQAPFPRSGAICSPPGRPKEGSLIPDSTHEPERKHTRRSFDEKVHLVSRGMPWDNRHGHRVSGPGG
jgi:16S rRNA G966 N2-methylase RsmD